jgi:hypothetical protein
VDLIKWFPSSLALAGETFRGLGGPKLQNWAAQSIGVDVGTLQGGDSGGRASWIFQRAGSSKF